MYYICSGGAMALGRTRGEYKKITAFTLFFVELALDDNNQEFFNTSILLHTIVVIKNHHDKMNDSPQRHKCQLYGHDRNYCHY